MAGTPPRASKESASPAHKILLAAALSPRPAASKRLERPQLPLPSTDTAPFYISTMIGRQVTAVKRLSALLASTSLAATCAFVHHIRPLPRSAASCSVRLDQSRENSSLSFERLTLEKLVQSLKEGHYKKVLVVSGAGVSCSAGIPDFRTPGSGLYDNLHKYDLPYPEAIFDVDFYRQNPMPFVTLSKEIWPGVNYAPTLTHCFFTLLDKRGILQRAYTQNIDGLEAVAGVDPEKMVECHGHFRSAKCINCGSVHDADDCKASMLEKGQPPKCKNCSGLVKPDIVFFGEVMPNRFSDLVHYDVAAADLVIVLGTSLLVAPVANIPDWVKGDCHRLLVNRELAGTFGSKPTDLFLEGDCDDSVRKICQLAGWEAELDLIYNETHSKQ